MSNALPSSMSTVIFAPRPQNYTLSSVTVQAGITEPIPLETLTDPTGLVARRMLDNIRRLGPELQELLAMYLRDYLETSFITTTLKLPNEMGTPEARRVPARDFPYARHLNLMALPTVEGMFFDPDEFVER